MTDDSDGVVAPSASGAEILDKTGMQYLSGPTRSEVGCYVYDLSDGRDDAPHLLRAASIRGAPAGT